MALVARMYYLDDLDQQQIAGVVGASRSTVSRLLTAARELGIVRISVDEHDPRDNDLEARLRDRFGLRHTVVVRAPGRTPASIRRSIGYFAAPWVSTLLQPGAVVGMGGGRTLKELVTCLEPGGQPSVSVVQLMGNIGATASEIDALELSRVLARASGGALYTVNAPALVQDSATRDLFLAHEHIRQVWRMLGTLQIAFVGIGSPDDSVLVERGVLDSAALDELRAAGAVGEICVRYFDPDGRECATDHRDRVVGIGLDLLRATPEVVGVTNGASRAAAARAAVAGRLVTSLVVDDRCAEAMLAI